MFANIARQNMEEFRKSIGEVEYEGPIAQFDNRLIGILIPRKGPKEEVASNQTPVTGETDKNHAEPATGNRLQATKDQHAQNKDPQNHSETDQKDHLKRDHAAPQDVQPASGAPQV